MATVVDKSSPLNDLLVDDHHNDDELSLIAIIDGLANDKKVFVVLGIFLALVLLKKSSEKERKKYIENISRLTVLEMIIKAIAIIYNLKVTINHNRLVFGRTLSICKECGSRMVKKAGLLYQRSTEEFFRDLGISPLAGLFPEKIFIQRFICTNGRCRTTRSSLKRVDLPNSIYSSSIMDLLLTTYLGSGASLRVIGRLCQAVKRPVSHVFIWRQVQRVGRLFDQQLDYLRQLSSGHFGVDECYPQTTKGKTGILAAIDQLTGLIVQLEMSKTFKKNQIESFLKDLQMTAPLFYSLMTDLSTIYTNVCHNLTGRIIHYCCQFHVKRNFKQFLESSLRKTKLLEDKDQQDLLQLQMRAILLSADDIFCSSSPVEALKKIDLLLEKRDRFGSHPELPSLFKYLARHKDLLVQTIDPRSIPVTNNPIERFFGHVRHKLKNVRGWKRKETLLVFVCALAVYRNYLVLEEGNFSLDSVVLGRKVNIGQLSFFDYLKSFFPSIALDYTDVLPVYTSTDCNNLLSELVG